MHNLYLNPLDLWVRDFNRLYYNIGCWVGAFDEKKIQEILKLDSNCKPVAILPIGFNNGKPLELPKK